MTTFEDFKLWYATSIASNTFALAASNLKFQNTSSPIGEDIELIYVLPQSFQKRATDVSNAIAVDPTSPDTGTAGATVILRFLQKRLVPQAAPVLAKLLAMFYKKSSDGTFHKGRFGIESTDNPNLDCLPIATAGYKFVSFKQEPNQNNPAVQIWEVTLKFVGDNSKLGTRSP